MNIKILSGVPGAQSATGITVVIDVLRAATVAAYLLDRGVKTITPVATKEEAFAYKETDQDLILVGEDKGIKLPGFDLGNSPVEIKNSSDLAGKHGIHRSSTGTQGLVNAHQASEVIFGSFVTASAIYKYIRQQEPDDVSLVWMYAFEDKLCAEFLRDQLLETGDTTMSEIVNTLETHPDCERFFDPENDLFPIEDFYLSMELDAFSFVPLVRNDKIVRFDV